MNRRRFLASASAVALLPMAPARPLAEAAAPIGGKLGEWQGVMWEPDIQPFQLEALERLAAAAKSSPLIKPIMIDGEAYYSMWLER